ncbi:hypothetical protein J437_LFUL012552, partial [Ladona fulva]
MTNRLHHIPLETWRNLLLQAPAPPSLYGLPKVLKEGVPLRPIVSAINSPTYHLAKFLSKLLAPYIGRCKHHVKNSADFVKLLSKLRLDPKDLMVSFDVISLFTKVPIEDSLKLLRMHFDTNWTKLFEHTLISTLFVYQGKMYEQISPKKDNSRVFDSVSGWRTVDNIIGATIISIDTSQADERCGPEDNQFLLHSHYQVKSIENARTPKSAKFGAERAPVSARIPTIPSMPPACGCPIEDVLARPVPGTKSPKPILQRDVTQKYEAS